MNYRFEWSVLWDYREGLLTGLRGTFALFLPAALFSVAVGMFIGTAKNSRNIIISDFAGYYVHTFRNIPAIVVLFFLYFAYKLDSYSGAVIGLAIHHSAYVAEVTQAGIRSSSRSLLRTAQASGFTVAKAYYYVILPVAFRVMLPPLTTQMLELLKNTSIAMTISFVELTYSVSSISEDTFRGFEAATAGTVLYGLLALLLIAFMNRLETRFRVRL